MNLDTEQLKSKIHGEMNRLDEQKANLEKEIARLESEKERLGETVQAVESVERIAKEIEVLDKLDDSAVRDEARHSSESAADETAAQGETRVQDFKQWARS